jgi:hypothetical protein
MKQTADLQSSPTSMVDGGPVDSCEDVRSDFERIDGGETL